MTDAPGHALPSATGTLQVRDGLCMHWGVAPARPPADADSIGVSFHLASDTGQMVLNRAPAACHCAAMAGAFHVTIVASARVITELLAGDSSGGAAALRAFAGGSNVSFSHPLTARARLAVDSIQRCPFAGVCRTMALTARCHDLLVEFLSAWTATLRPVPAAAPGITERVRLAAEILERDLEHPPALPVLAARVGLSETSLKRAFPRIFGTTVFGYLRRRRMEEARRLLESGAATVLEAAAQVGYSNPSNFAAAFRREFGVNPKTHQLAVRR